MSRAFVKDDDDSPEPPIDIPVSDEPHYVTPDGYVQLERRIAEAEARGDDRDARFLSEQRARAVVVDPAEQSKKTVQFGATVSVHDDTGRAHSFQIVGQSEADPVHGKISDRSPVAQALLGKRRGAKVTVVRPAGAIRYTIDNFEYR